MAIVRVRRDKSYANMVEMDKPHNVFVSILVCHSFIIVRFLILIFICTDFHIHYIQSDFFYFVSLYFFFFILSFIYMLFVFSKANCHRMEKRWLFHIYLIYNTMCCLYCAFPWSSTNIQSKNINLFNIALSLYEMQEWNKCATLFQPFVCNSILYVLFFFYSHSKKKAF